MLKLGGSGTPPAHVESIGFILPLDLKSAVDRFQEYYTTKYNGRRLTWLYTSCSGIHFTARYNFTIVFRRSAYHIPRQKLFDLRIPVSNFNANDFQLS